MQKTFLFILSKKTSYSSFFWTKLPSLSNLFSRSLICIMLSPCSACSFPSLLQGILSSSISSSASSISCAKITCFSVRFLSPADFLTTVPIYWHRPLERGDCPALLWAGTALSSSPGGNFGCHNVRKTSGYWRNVQRRDTEIVKRLEGKPYKEWLRAFGSAAERTLSSHLTWDLSAPPKGSTGTALLSALCDQGQEPRECQELCQGTIRLAIRERFFSSEAGQALNRFSRQWAQPQGCQRSRSVWPMLSGMQRVGLLECLCRARSWTLTIPRGPFRLRKLFPFSPLSSPCTMLSAYCSTACSTSETSATSFQFKHSSTGYNPKIDRLKNNQKETPVWNVVVLSASRTMKSIVPCKF